MKVSKLELVFAVATLFDEEDDPMKKAIKQRVLFHRCKQREINVNPQPYGTMTKPAIDPLTYQKARGYVEQLYPETVDVFPGDEEIKI